MSDSLPSIFVIAVKETPTEYHCFALAEDGTGLAGHISSSREWATRDMGITSHNKHELYVAHYPNGFNLVDLTALDEDELRMHTGYMRAYLLNK